MMNMPETISMAQLRIPAMTVSVGGVVTGINSAAEELLGTSAELVTGATVQQLLTPTASSDSLSNLVEYNQPLRVNVSGQDGTTIPLLATCGAWAEDQQSHLILLTDLREFESSVATGSQGTVSAADHWPPLQGCLANNVEGLRLMARYSADVVSVHSLSGDLQAWSPALPRLLGWSDAELQATSWMERVHLDEWMDVQRIQAANRRGESASTRFRMLKKDGSHAWLQATLMPIGSGDQEPRVIWAARDVSSQVKAERRFKAANELLLSFVRHAPAAVAMVDREMRYIAHSTRWNSEFHIPQESLVGRSHFDVYPETSARWREAYERCLAGVVERFPAEPFDCSDGIRRWLRWHLQPWYTAEGTVGGLMFQIEDITQQHAADEVLRTLAQRFEQAESVAGIGHWTRDLFSGEVTWSRQMYRLFGVRESNGPLSFTQLLDRLEAESAERLKEAVRIAQTRGKGYSIQLTLKEEHNGCRHLQSDAEVLWTPDGLVNSIFGTVLDVTDQVRREAELNHARLQAEESSRMKSEFLANMSHEIRTPMTAILGFADLLCEPETVANPQRMQELVTAITRNGQHMLKLVNDILDLSKIEAGKLLTEVLPTDPAAIIDGILQMLGPRATDQGITLRCIYETEIPKSFPCDPVRLRQTLINLMSNAIKFTAVGQVTLRVSAKRAKEQAHIRFEIEDTGIGMTEEQVEKLFQPFMQADLSTTRRFGGTGLGLAISKRLSEALGGNIQVRSALGEGSIFTVELPLENPERLQFWQPQQRRPAAANEDPLLPSPEKVHLEGISVLLAEDGVDNQRLITHMLRKAGASVYVVGNGSAALESICPAGDMPQSIPFDLILMDMQMPVMDGYTAARRLKELACPIPIIALTANAMSGDREKCLATGCDDYVSKPIDRNIFLQTCANVIGVGSR